MTYVMTLLPLVLLLLGFPIFVILLSASAVAILGYYSVPATAIPQVMFGQLDSAVLLAVPFFILAGELMGAGSISKRLVSWAQAFLGWMKAGLPLTTILSTIVFGAISGSSAATVAAVGRITFDPMVKQGYSKRFASGLLAASGLIDNMIPPSIAMILYAAVSETSLVRLFTAGFVPGFLFAAGFCIYIMAVASRTRLTAPPSRFSARLALRATLNSATALGMPVIILGGIYAGIVSATEAAATACVYALIISVFVHRDLKPMHVFELARRSAFITSQVMLIVAAAGVFSWLLVTSGVTAALNSYLSHLELSQWQLLLAINILLLIVGCFIDTTSAILLLTPILVPIVRNAGVDLIHFGIVLTANLSIGCFTPPFGINIFVVQAVMRQPVRTIYAGIGPFVLISVIVLLLLTYVPATSLLLTRLHD